MKVITYSTWSKFANGTSLKGYVNVDYHDLVELFGNPMDGDGYKVDAEWHVHVDNGKGDRAFATIYNYKTGKSYLGEEGLPVEDIKVWHVGGKTRASLDLLVDYMETTPVPHAGSTEYPGGVYV